MMIRSSRALAAAVLIAAGAASAQDMTGAGATFPAPIYAKWADAYHKATGRARQLPVGRLRRRHPADPRQDGRLRCLRHAARRRRARQGRPGPVPDRDRRRRPGRQHQGHRARTDQADGPGARRHLPRQDHEVERCRADGPQPGRCASRRGDLAGAPRRRLGNVVHLHQLPVEGERRLEGQGRRGHGGELAGRRGRQGQRGRRCVRAAPAELDRLRRVRLRQAEQDDVHAAAKQGRPIRCAGRRQLQGRCRRRRLVEDFLPGAHRSARQGRVADQRRDLHPDVQGVRKSRRAPPIRSSSSTGPTATATRWPTISSTCRCRPRSRSSFASRGRPTSRTRRARRSPGSSRRGRDVPGDALPRRGGQDASGHEEPPADRPARLALGRRDLLRVRARRCLADAGAAGGDPGLARDRRGAGDPRLRPVVPVDQRMGSGPEPLRRPGDDLRHADDVVHRAADRGAGQLRHRALPHRAVAALAQAPARHRDRAARGGALDRLRHVGPARLQPDPVALRPAAAASDLQGRAAARLAVLRARRSASACCRPGSSWRSWSSRSSPR